LRAAQDSFASIPNIHIHSLGLRILRENTDHHHRLEMREHKYATIYRGEEMQTKLSPHIQTLCELNNLNPKAANGGDSRQKFAIKNLKFRIQRRLLDINQKHRATLNGPSFEDFVSLVEHFGVFTPNEEKSKTFREELEIYYAAHRLLLTAGTELAARSYIIDFTDMIRADIVGAKEEFGQVENITVDEVVERAKAGDLIISRLRAPLLVLIFDFIDDDVKVQVAEDEAREFINELKSLFKQDELQASIKRRYRGFEALKDIVLQRNRWVIRQNAAKIPKATEREIFIEAENEYLEKRLEFLHSAVPGRERGHRGDGGGE